MRIAIRIPKEYRPAFGAVAHALTGAIGTWMEMEDERRGAAKGTTARAVGLA